MHTDIQHHTVVHRTARTEPWAGPAVRALRRAQPPPTGWREASRREHRIWAYLAAVAILATLVLTAASVSSVDFSGFRLLLAIAVPAIAGLVVTACGGRPRDATEAASGTSHGIGPQGRHRRSAR